MTHLLDKWPFLITVLLVLLLGNSSSVVWQNSSQQILPATTSLETEPVNKAELLLPRVISPRSLQPESPIPRKDPVPWPTVIVTLASLMALICYPCWIPRHYLTTDNHRLSGWRDANLQFRFIHSR